MKKKSNQKTEIHGDVERLTQIGNVEGNVIVQATQQSSISELKKRGCQLVAGRSYMQAINVFEEVLGIDSTVSEIHYYIALSLLNGKRPKLLGLQTIRKAEEHLKNAIRLDKRCGHAYILWAIIKYDFYVLNGMFDRSPTYDELLNMEWNLEANYKNELLTHVGAKGNKVWDWLKAQ